MVAGFYEKLFYRPNNITAFLKKKYYYAVRVA